MEPQERSVLGEHQNGNDIEPNTYVAVFVRSQITCRDTFISVSLFSVDGFGGKPLFNVRSRLHLDKAQSVLFQSDNIGLTSNACPVRL